jgi:three-Cys-motif partner protein
MGRRDEKYRLFSLDDLLSAEELEATKAISSGAQLDIRADLDSATMYLSKDDKLLVRGVWPHSAEKSWMVSRIIDVVSKAMSGKWRELGYLELYAGPGRLLDRRTGIELPGSPIQALRIRTPFDRYVFCDFDDDCVSALRVRTDREDFGSRADVRQGNAKDRNHLTAVASAFGTGSLVITYLDPARPQDMTWETVAVLAEELRNVDLIINLPVFSLQRAISGPHARDAAARAAAQFLGHPDPTDLLQWNRKGEHDVTGTITAIREFYDSQLQTLGFLAPGRRIVELSPRLPYYDVLYVSRHPLGIGLWDRANPPQLPEPSLLDILDDPKR